MVNGRRRCTWHFYTHTLTLQGLGVVDISNSLIDPHIVTVNVWRWDGLAWIKEYQWAYATGRQEEEDGRTLVCDKRDKAVSYVFCRDLHLTPMFSGLLRKDLFKGK